MKKIVLFIVPILLIFSCTKNLYVADAEFEQKCIPFIKDGVALKEDIILRLGEPSWVFENGRIVTYRLFVDYKGKIKPAMVNNDKTDSTFSYVYAYGPRQYSLVLIFDNKNVLEKHSLVRVNP